MRSQDYRRPPKGLATLAIIAAPAAQDPNSVSGTICRILQFESARGSSSFGHNTASGSIGQGLTRPPGFGGTAGPQTKTERDNIRNRRARAEHDTLKIKNQRHKALKIFMICG